MSIRDRVNDSIARQQEWGTDNGPYFVGPDGEQQDMREWGDEEWALYFGEGEEEDELGEGKSGGSSGGGSSSHRDDEFLSYMAFMETESSRMDNYM